MKDILSTILFIRYIFKNFYPEFKKFWIKRHFDLVIKELNFLQKDKKSSCNFSKKMERGYFIEKNKLPDFFEVEANVFINFLIKKSTKIRGSYNPFKKTQIRSK